MVPLQGRHSFMFFGGHRVFDVYIYINIYLNHPRVWNLSLPKTHQKQTPRGRNLTICGGFRCIYIYIPGTCLSFVLGVEPSKRRPFPIKTRVIWVPLLPAVERRDHPTSLVPGGSHLRRPRHSLGLRRFQPLKAVKAPENMPSQKDNSSSKPPLFRFFCLFKGW